MALKKLDLRAGPHFKAMLAELTRRMELVTARRDSVKNGTHRLKVIWVRRYEIKARTVPRHKRAIIVKVK